MSDIFPALAEKLRDMPTLPERYTANRVFVSPEYVRGGEWDIVASCIIINKARDKKKADNKE
jgi:hypothetical protein